MCGLGPRGGDHLHQISVKVSTMITTQSDSTISIFRGTSVSLLTCLKNALRLFLYNKSTMNPEHEFALVVLTNEANWVSPPCPYVRVETHL